MPVIQRTDEEKQALIKAFAEKHHLSSLLGVHVDVNRSNRYHHHGIISSHDGSKVIHYSKRDKVASIQEEDFIDCFLFDNSIDDLSIVEYPSIEGMTHFTAEEIVQRARDRIGEANYSLWGANCEHFASWCASGDRYSRQIEDHGASLYSAGSLMTGLGVVTSALGLAVVFLGSVLKQKARRDQ